MKNIAVCDGFIGRRPGCCYSMGISRPELSASGNPLLLNSAEAPLTALTLYGWSKQDGTPSPENPVPIVSAGDEGEINVTISDGGTQSQFLTVSAPGGLPGIPVDASKLPEGMEPTYVDESGQAWICDEVDFEKGVYVRRVWKHTFDGSENWSLYGIAEATSNYGFLLGGALPEPMSYRNGFTNQLEVIENSPSESDRNKFRFGVGTGITTVYALHVDQYDPSLEDGGLANWKAHLAVHPLEVMTYLTTATEEPLTAEEIAAYKALHTYSPATTVSNDAEAWMKVGYYGLTAIQKLEKEALMINGGKT